MILQVACRQRAVARVVDGNSVEPVDVVDVVQNVAEDLAQVRNGKSGSAATVGLFLPKVRFQFHECASGDQVSIRWHPLASGEDRADVPGRGQESEARQQPDFRHLDKLAELADSRVAGEGKEAVDGQFAVCQQLGVQRASGHWVGQVHLDQQRDRPRGS